jgi:hypothetical protein
MSNLTNNRLNVVMTDQQVAAVKTAIQTIATNMPFLIGLTTDERIGLPKINVSNKAFAEDALNAVSNNAGMLPVFINVQQMQNDYKLFTQLDELLGVFRQLLEKAEDTQMLAGSEAYVAALTSYKLFMAASDAGIVGADAIVNSLRQRFVNTVGTENGTAPQP